MSQSGKIESLEGLRGIAALIVVASHIRQLFLPELSHTIATAVSSLPWPLDKLVTAITEAPFDGNYAVYTFWVLSGFVLSLKYWTAPASNPGRYLLSSAVKRYLRLAPPVLFSTLFALALIKSGLIVNQQLAQHHLAHHPDWSAYAQWLSAFFSSPPQFTKALQSGLWDTFFHYDRTTTYNAVLWTIEKEFTGSLLLFTALALTNRLTRVGPLWLAASIGSTLVRTHWLTAFLIGAWIARSLPQLKATFLRHPNIQHPLAIFIIITSLGITIGLPNYHGIANLILATITVVLVLTLHQIQKILSRTTFTTLGKLSFSLYLIHFPLLASISSLIFLSVSKFFPQAASASAILATIAILPPASYISFVIADRPAKKLANTLAKRLAR